MKTTYFVYNDKKYAEKDLPELFKAMSISMNNTEISMDDTISDIEESPKKCSSNKCIDYTELSVNSKTRLNKDVIIERIYGPWPLVEITFNKKNPTDVQLSEISTAFTYFGQCNLVSEYNPKTRSMIIQYIKSEDAQSMMRKKDTVIDFINNVFETY